MKIKNVVILAKLSSIAIQCIIKIKNLAYNCKKIERYRLNRSENCFLMCSSKESRKFIAR